MKVSIVTISYNQADFLEKAILSVVDQDYANVEYIVVDPGSTDGSRHIIERYRARISQVIFEPDRGPADGLNIGFSKASGEIFGFLNSDDILLPRTLSHVVRFFQTHPYVDVVSGHTMIIDEHDRPIRSSYSDSLSLNRYAYEAAVIMQPSTFFRADSFKKSAGFNVHNRTNWDGELFVDLRLQGARFALMNRFLSGYRLQPQSITSSKKFDDGIKAYHKMMFRKIKGRDPRKLDALLKIYYRFLKHITSPRALYQRLIKGKIYGRKTRQDLLKRGS